MPATTSDAGCLRRPEEVIGTSYFTTHRHRILLRVPRLWYGGLPAIERFQGRCPHDEPPSWLGEVQVGIRGSRGRVATAPLVWGAVSATLMVSLFLLPLSFIDARWLTVISMIDASVTQSALEEALASRMQDGTIGSRMSTLGNAFRSRYLPGGAGGASSSRQ